MDLQGDMSLRWVSCAFLPCAREVYVQNEDGTRSDVVKERTYDLKSKTQGRMIQVSIPASVPSGTIRIMRW